jgi:protein-S-isoprenylcysteine O-methyltransferase Ste14
VLVGNPVNTSAATRSLTLVRLCQAALNIVVLLLFVLLVASAYQHFAATRSIRFLGILVVNSLFLGLFVTRRAATAETDSLPLWLLAVAGTVCPLLLRPSDGAGFIGIGSVIQITGIALMASGLLSLRRSFAVVPGNRGIREGGLYRIVRHPIYFSELVAILGAVLVNPSLANWAIWLCECGLQFARARAEEEFLSADPVYRAYRERVRYRLIPGIL